MMSDFTHQAASPNVTGEIAPFLHNLLTIANLVYFFGRNQYLRYILAQVTVANICLEIFLDLAFFSTDGTQYVHFFSISDILFRLMRVDKFHNPLEERIHSENHQRDEQGSI